MSINWIILVILISTIAAIAAMLTAFAAYKTIHATKEAAELPILKDFLAEYYSIGACAEFQRPETQTDDIRCIGTAERLYEQIP